MKAGTRSNTVSLNISREGVKIVQWRLHTSQMEDESLYIWASFGSVDVQLNLFNILSLCEIQIEKRLST